MGYAVGFDLGTTWSAAAVVRDGRAEVVSLGTHAAAIPSVVFLRDDGQVLVGEAAERRATAEPTRVAREFKRRLGDPVPSLVGGSPIGAEALTGHLLAALVEMVVTQQGGDPDHAVVTVPANWGPYKLDLVRQAIRQSGLDRRCPTTLLTEPEAAAVHYASTERVPTGSVVAVYDLGGGTFDAALLRKTDDGYESLGTPEGIERLGGIDFDAAVLGFVDTATDGAVGALDPADPQAIADVAELRRRCVAAKEALSADTDVVIPVVLGDRRSEVRLTRHELEAVLRPALAESVAALRRAIESAELTPADLRAVLLVGGSSRIPLVAELVGAVGAPVAVDAHPKHAIALGAALAAAQQAIAAPVAAAQQAIAAPVAAAQQATAAPVADAPVAEPVAPEPEPVVAAPEPVEAPPTAPRPPVEEPVLVPAGAAGAATRSKAPLLVVGALVVVAVVAGILLAGGGGGGDDDVASGSDPSGADDGSGGVDLSNVEGLGGLAPIDDPGFVLFRDPDVSDPDTGEVTEQGHVFRMVAEEGGAVDDITEALIDLGDDDGYDNFFSASGDGSQILVMSTRLGGCVDPSCPVLLSPDLASFEVIELRDQFGNGVYVDGAPAISNDGTTIVFAANPGPEAPHPDGKDLYVSTREPGSETWTTPVVLTADSTFQFNEEPSLSPSGDVVAFSCGDVQYFETGGGVCLVDLDGSTFFQLIGPDDHPNAIAGTSTALHPDWVDDQHLIFEATWPVRAIFTTPVDSPDPSPVDTDFVDDQFGCVLPNGRIVTQWHPPDSGSDNAVIKVMEADGSAAAVIYDERPLDFQLSCG